MEADEILRQASEGPDKPHGWIVLPLLRRKLIFAIAGWVFGTILGLGLFAGMAYVVIPSNYLHGVFAALLTTLFLAMLLFVGLGSLWTLFIDLGRLWHLDRHIIIITPEDFVKQEGDKIIHVPLMYVRNVTARGRSPVDRSAPKESQVTQIAGAGENVASLFFGRAMTPSGARERRRRMRTPTSLAFIDTRTNSEVTVVTDETYGDPFMIAALLKKYAATV